MAKQQRVTWRFSSQEGRRKKSRGAKKDDFSTRERGKATIVEYSAEKAPYNGYPKRIVSPPAPKRCCLRHMEQIGGLHQDGGWSFYYKRCTKCGFTVRVGCSKDLGRLLQSLRKQLAGQKRW